MAVHISDIKISRPPYLGGESWELSGLSDVTVLFGRNSSGKSILLRSWRDADIQNTHYVGPERSGQLSFEPGQLQQQLNPEGRKSQSERNLIPNYHQQVITRIQTYFAVRGDCRGNEQPAGDPDEIEKVIGLLIPDFFIRISPKITPPYELVRVSTNEKVADINQLSSGEAQILTIGLDITIIGAIWELEQKEKRVILIDEPDAHIHPDLQIRFASFIHDMVARFNLQVIVATHSTTLLTALGQFGDHKTSVLYLDRTQPSFKAQELDDVKREMAACLGGHTLMGPLFGAPILLVEGDDDSRIWSQVPRHQIINLSVIPCRGDEIIKYQKSLEKIFTSLSDPPSQPFGFALRDGDKTLPTPNPDNPQKYVRFIALNCHEAENLYLTDEVLQDLELTWDEASQKLVDGSSNHGEKADLIKAVSRCDRKKHDVKLVINEIAMILDSKRVHWTTRVGRRIGRERPKGQLADFLGDDVISSLWPRTKSEEA